MTGMTTVLQDGTALNLAPTLNNQPHESASYGLVKK